MGLAKSAVIFWSLMMMMALCGVSMAANHKVGGDSAGWTAQARVDYTKWASAKNFHVGDTLRFAYNSQFHDVLQVTQQDFQSSNATSPVATNISGSDSIKLKRCPYAHLFSPSAVTAPTPTPSNAPVLYSSKLWFAVTVLAVLLIKLKQ